MDDLIAFLRARFDEDERVARAVAWADRAAFWHVTPRGVVSDIGIVVERDVVIIANQRHDKLEHIARHDPARVQREVEAKRALLGLWSRATSYDRRGMYSLRTLALPYADHPDYRLEWRP
ncbi:DUF6221 family protein [Nonomuraea sp. NPDC050790]|uniref:DUF6221 family protein n=1 Tax=Nonomuraea sp. NPDC050790 TaxID=3364371 RepID=UPI003791F10F